MRGYGYWFAMKVPRRRGSTTPRRRCAWAANCILPIAAQIDDLSAALKACARAREGVRAARGLARATPHAGPELLAAAGRGGADAAQGVRSLLGCTRRLPTVLFCAPAVTATLAARPFGLLVADWAAGGACTVRFCAVRRDDHGPAAALVRARCLRRALVPPPSPRVVMPARAAMSASACAWRQARALGRARARGHARGGRADRAGRRRGGRLHTPSPSTP